MGHIKLMFLLLVFLFSNIQTKEISVSESTFEFDLVKHYENMVNDFTSNRLTGMILSKIYK